MIFQHGVYGDTLASETAVSLMKKALELDTSVNKWLYAAAVDRNEMYKGEPQLYGTQWYRSSDTLPFQIYTIDTLAITDSERKKYGVLPFNEPQKQVDD